MFKRTLTLMSLSLILFASCGSEVASVTTPAVTNGANTGAPPAGNPPAGMPANGQRGPGALPPNAEELRVEYPEFIAALEGIQDLEPQARAEALDQLYVEHPEWKDILPAPPAGGQAGPPPGGQAPVGGQPPAGGGNGAPPPRPGAPAPSPSAA